jgi:NAD(P)H dehydrogenase (quinone)
MAKILVTYYTRTGNTAEMARLLAESMQKVHGVEVTVRRVEDVQAQDLPGYDAILLGSPVYYGGPPAEVKKLIDASVEFHGKLEGKLGGAFASSANVGGGNETTVLDIVHYWLIHGMLVVGDYRGDHYGPVSIGPPDDRARKVCHEYGRMFAQMAKRIFG